MVKIGKFNTVWGKLANSKNTELLFTCEIELHKKQEVIVELVAKDIYNLFVNGKFVSYGPARTAKGYCRMERIDITSHLVDGVNAISVYVYSNDTVTSHIAQGAPFFGARILAAGKLIKETKDFTCYHNTDRIQKVERMSSQRGYLEIYDVKGQYPEVEVEDVKCPKVLERKTSYSTNRVVKADYLLEGSVCVDNTHTWENDFTRQLDTGARLDAYPRQECDCILSKELLSFHYKRECDSEGLQYLIYEFPRVSTGKFVIRVSTIAKTNIWVTFDELLTDGYLRFNREHIIHGLKWTLNAGEYTLYSQEVYAAKYIQLILDANVQIQDVSIICVENPDVMAFEVPPMEEELNTIVEAARNSLAQNAYDIFTDCPTRERSGFICDSFFMGKAENFFTGQNKVEKDFLENYLLYNNEVFEHEGVMPMCYPSQPKAKDDYIPAWILWYVLELKDYLERTGDITFIGLHRQRLLDILDFFQGYENEYGLLENLEGWVFVEWSKASDFVDGVNFPTNILYTQVLRVAGELLERGDLVEKSEKLIQVIRDMAYDGEVYRDNAVRVDGKLQVTENVSEFNQTIVAYFRVEPETSEFYQKFKERFRAVKTEVHPTALFIGSVLRLMTLYDMGEYELVLKECEEHFLEMAKMTGTIWELFGGNASCNHGFGAVVGKVVCEAVLKLQKQGGETHEKR